MKYIVDESQFKLLLNKLKPSIFKYWDKNGPGLTNNFYSTFSISSFRNIEYMVELLSEWMGSEEKLIKFIKKDEGETFRIIDGGYNFQIILDEVTVNEYQVYLDVRVVPGGTVTLIFDEGQPTIPLEEALTNDKYGWEINSEVAEVIHNKFFKFYSDLGITIADIDVDYM
jgi:hypothetical protein